jgi:hypothetical protein
MLKSDARKELESGYYRDWETDEVWGFICTHFPNQADDRELEVIVAEIVFGGAE